MQQKLIQLLQRVIGEKVPIHLEIPKQKGHGDFSTNVAFLLAKEAKKNPRELAQQFIEKMKPLPDWIEKVEVAGPGFINFHLTPKVFFEALGDVCKQGEKFGRSSFGEGKKVILEFVSANPTGPLNIVSARAAAIGDTLANLLNAVGYNVTREFYVNDVGRQIDLFALSIAARYKQVLGEAAEIPEEGYQGEYLKDLGKHLALGKKKKYSLADFRVIGLETMLAWQKKSLKNFGVEFDNWFLQSKLVGSKEFQKTLQQLEKSGHLYENDGALFFKTTVFGDDKDRVVKKQDGEYTYFASDIVYHHNKFQRKFDWAIDLLGPDHHGYVARTKASVEALGHKPEQLTVLIVQQVNLIKEQVIVKMSKRAGRLVTMDDLITEVGKDVARFFFLQRSASAHLDFDLELAKKETPENPVFYIQYAHARIASIFRKATESKIKLNPKKVSLEVLDLPEEKELAKLVLHFPDLVLQAAKNLEPHLLAFYCLDLARQLQAYYSQAKLDLRYRVIDPSNLKKTNAKLYLLKNIQIVLQNGLALLGISAPEKMEAKDVTGSLQQ